MIDRRPIVLAAGGTGGHMFPAQALAAALQERGHRIVLVADTRGAVIGGPLAAVETERIPAAGWSGRRLPARALALVQLARGYLRARRLLRRYGPLVVVGFGSYPSLPTMLAAVHLRMRTVIHEQNAILGRANRLLAPRVTRIATAFHTVQDLREDDRDKAIWTGNPVRPEVAALAATPYAAPGEDGPVRLLVFGGSQGAAVFDAVVPKALAALPQGLRSRLRVVQQCRPENLDAVRADYASCGISAETASFFGDLPHRIASAHLVICRSGASTIAELTTIGRPAILVPFPHATDGHQKANAIGLCDAGGGWIIEQELFTAERLAERLSGLLSLDPTLATAAGCALRIGVPDAARRLADLVTTTINGNGAPVADGGDATREAA